MLQVGPAWWKTASGIPDLVPAAGLPDVTERSGVARLGDSHNKGILKRLSAQCWTIECCYRIRRSLDYEDVKNDPRTQIFGGACDQTISIERSEFDQKPHLTK